MKYCFQTKWKCSVQKNKSSFKQDEAGLGGQMVWKEQNQQQEFSELCWTKMSLILFDWNPADHITYLSHVLFLQHSDSLMSVLNTFSARQRIPYLISLMAIPSLLLIWWPWWRLCRRKVNNVLVFQSGMSIFIEIHKYCVRSIYQLKIDMNHIMFFSIVIKW